MKVPPGKRAQAEQIVADALKRQGLTVSEAAALAAALTAQAISGLEAGRKPEDPDFVTDDEASQILDETGDGQHS